MATDQLAIYNIALAAIGERSLTSVTENREPRRLLDEIWDRGGGAIRYCLEQGLWNFAMRAVQLDASTSISPSFGYTYAFDIPTDLVRIGQIAAGEYFTEPMTRYEIEGAYIYADIDPIYLRYVSDDTSWGNDLSLWPDTFTLWVGHWLATQLGPRLTNDLDLERLERRTKRLLADARSKDAMQEATRWPPLGSWARARYGGASVSRERGSRSRLIG